MDPVSAFGIVTSVMQVLEFGRAATKTCLEVYKHGVSNENLSIEKTTKHLAAASGRLQITLREHRRPGVVVQDDLQLQSLAAECGDIAQDLLELLDRLKPKGSGRARQLDSLKKGLVSLWQRDEVKRLELHLEKLKRVLDGEVLHRLT